MVAFCPITEANDADPQLQLVPFANACPLLLRMIPFGTIECPVQGWSDMHEAVYRAQRLQIKIRRHLISSAEPRFLHAWPWKTPILNLDLHLDYDPDIVVSSLRGHLRSKIEPGQDWHNVVANHKALFFANVRLFGALLLGKCLHRKD